MPKLTSTQIGKIAENVAANTLILGSNGALAPFTPIADDEGIDLLLYHKPTGRVLPIQVKARTKTLKRKGSEKRSEQVHFEVRKVVQARSHRTYLLAILLDESAATIARSWLIPFAELPKIASDRGAKYVIRPSRSIETQDKFRKYLMHSPSALVDALTGLFERFDNRWPPASSLGGAV